MKLNLLLSLLILCSLTTQSQNVGIGNPTPAEKLDVTGNINVTGTIKANGTAGTPHQVLTTNSAGNLAWAYGSQYPYFVSFRSSTSWIVPAGVTQLMIEAWGGGGGASTVTGGGGGGYIVAIVNVTPGMSLTITVGSGGSGGSSSTNGGSSSVLFTGNQIIGYGGASGDFVPNGGNYGLAFSDGNLIGYDGEYGESGSTQTTYVVANGSGTTYLSNTIMGAGGDAGNGSNTGGKPGIASGVVGVSYNGLSAGTTVKPARVPGGGGAVNGTATTATVYNNGANGKVVIHY
jgi:hypothetical protein